MGGSSFHTPSLNSKSPLSPPGLLVLLLVLFEWAGLYGKFWKTSVRHPRLNFLRHTDSGIAPQVDDSTTGETTVSVPGGVAAHSHFDLAADPLLSNAGAFWTGTR
jgi:hypothetical protein